MNGHIELNVKLILSNHTYEKVKQRIHERRPRQNNYSELFLIENEISELVEIAIDRIYGPGDGKRPR